MSELPHQDQGVMVLRVGPRGSTLVETPVNPSPATQATRSWSVDLDARGSGQVSEDLTIAGQAAPDWRQHYQTPGERLERYQKVWNGRFPGAQLEALTIDGAEDRNQPVRVRAKVEVPRLGELGAAGTMILPLTSSKNDFVRSYARLSARRWDLVLSYPWQHREQLVFKLPAGWRGLRLPSRRTQDTPFGTWTLEVVPSGESDASRQITVRSTVDVQKHRITPKEYPAFRAFLGAIDRAFAERIVLQRDGK
jgi:hypothetical protein